MALFGSVEPSSCNAVRKELPPPPQGSPPVGIVDANTMNSPRTLGGSTTRSPPPGRSTYQPNFVDQSSSASPSVLRTGTDSPSTVTEPPVNSRLTRSLRLSARFVAFKIGI